MNTSLGPAAPWLYAATALVVVFLLAPLVVPIAISFSDTAFVTFPAERVHAALVCEDPE